jgi:sulfate permease, SulP family
MNLQKIKDSIIQKRKTLKEDLIAGFIVAIVALPLALGFAIASGLDPAVGVYTAIIGGFFASVFGGSEFQISGPTGAMVVVVLSVVAQHGTAGLIVATFVAGIILLLLSALGLGKIIEYIPSPVIVGFTAGIGFIIFFGQLNNFFGISPKYPADATFLVKTGISLMNIINANFGAVIIGLLTVVILVLAKKFLKRIPGSIIAVIITTAIAFFFKSFLAIKTVGDIGKIPTTLPMPVIPHITPELVVIILPAAFSIAMLAAIESLLSAVVADSLTATRYKPNRELFGQGIANIASALFGGMPATGAIARTATNVRNGGKSRMSGIFHAIFLLIFVVAVAPLAEMIPLAALAGILMYVAYNMIEWDRIKAIFKTPMSDVMVMLTTFFITIVFDLIAAIEVGLVLAALLFMKRISDLYVVEDYEEETNGSSQIVRKFQHPLISIYTVSGPLFFGAASRFDQRVESTPGGHKPIKIIRLKHVPVIDATGLNFLESTFKKHKKMGGIVLFSSVRPDVMNTIRKSGIVDEIGEKHFFQNTKQALAHALKHAQRLRHEPEGVSAEELAKYNISELELQEAAHTPMSKDRDPVEDILESLHIIHIGKVGKKTIKTGKDTVIEVGKKTIKVGKETVKTGKRTVIVGKEHLHRTVKKTIQKTKDKTKEIKKKLDDHREEYLNSPDH